MARGARIGDYRLDQELVPGALYRAVHVVLPRHAFVKVAREPAGHLAVLREACLLAALPHPGVVRVYETRRDGELAWFAFEIVEGLTLAGPFAEAEPGAIEASVAVGMLRDVAEVLAHAHQRGVIHCAIRPERLVVARGRGFPICVTDWSAARAHDAAAAVPDEVGPFTAPELSAGDAIDDRADVWSLGVVAYRTLTGRMPFETVVTTPASGLFVPAEVQCPEAPRALTGLIDQMLAFDRWDRPTAAEVRGVLASPEPIPRAEPLRIRKPRWTPQIDLGTKLRADADDSSPPVVNAPTDPTTPRG